MKEEEKEQEEGENNSEDSEQENLGEEEKEQIAPKSASDLQELQASPRQGAAGHHLGRGGCGQHGETPGGVDQETAGRALDRRGGRLLRSLSAGIPWDRDGT